ncbi:MAG: hypothetical protein WEB52_03925 [Dehalococcoidia bacterium]
MKLSPADLARMRGKTQELVDKHHLPGIAHGRVTALRFDDCAMLRKNPTIEPWA